MQFLFLGAICKVSFAFLIGSSSFRETCLGLRGQDAQSPPIPIQVNKLFHLKLILGIVPGIYYHIVDCTRYHHYVQQQIKKRRRGKKVKIQFPKDVLKSGKYQAMLHNKVSKDRTR